MPTTTSNLGMQDFFTTTLSAAVTDANQLTIYLNSVPTDTEGYLVIDYSNSTTREIIFYNVVGANYVTCPADGRGQGGTTAQAHDLGADVRMNMVSGYFDGLKDLTAVPDDKVLARHLADGIVKNAHLDTTAGEPGGAWKDWTPTWTNLTVGSGGTVAASYAQIGKTVHFKLKFTYGTGSSVGTIPTFSLPVTSAASQVGHISTNVILNDVGVNAYLGRLFYASTTTANISTLSPSGTTIYPSTNITATAPFTWGSTDNFLVCGTYEAA